MQRAARRPTGADDPGKHDPGRIRWWVPGRGLDPSLARAHPRAAARVLRVKPFLLLGTRAEDEAADNEYDAFLGFTGLDESSLRRVRLEQRPLGQIDLDDWSGIFLGGGPFNASDDDASKSQVQLRVEDELRDLLDEVLTRDFPLLGACYGIGVIGTHRGGSVDRTYSEPIGRVPVTLTPSGRADPLFAELPDTFEAFVGHKEAVRDLPRDAVHLASSPACPVQAFRLGRNVYATQFHPELDIHGLCTRIEVYKHAGYFEPSQAETVKAMARAGRVFEPPKMLKAFVQRYAR
jgi:GMP synthase (glutamine-hydrolysing)